MLCCEALFVISEYFMFTCSSHVPSFSPKPMRKPFLMTFGSALKTHSPSETSCDSEAIATHATLLKPGPNFDRFQQSACATVHLSLFKRSKFRATRIR